MKKEADNRKFRTTFVLAGGMFMLTILLLVKVFPNSRIAPLLFLTGWAVFAVFLGKFLQDYKWRK